MPVATPVADGSVGSVHSTVAFSGQVMIGSVVSSIVKVATVLEGCPHSSVAVKTTSAPPVSPQPLDNAVKSLLHVTLPQLSEASAPPCEPSHTLSAAALPAPSHSSVEFDACVSILGAVASTTVMV